MSLVVSRKNNRQCVWSKIKFKLKAKIKNFWGGMYLPAMSLTESFQVSGDFNKRDILKYRAMKCTNVWKTCMCGKPIFANDQ